MLWLCNFWCVMLRNSPTYSLSWREKFSMLLPPKVETFFILLLPNPATPLLFLYLQAVYWRLNKRSVGPYENWSRTSFDYCCLIAKRATTRATTSVSSVAELANTRLP